MDAQLIAPCWHLRLCSGDGCVFRKQRDRRRDALSLGHLPHRSAQEHTFPSNNQILAGIPQRRLSSRTRVCGVVGQRGFSGRETRTEARVAPATSAICSEFVTAGRANIVEDSKIGLQESRWEGLGEVLKEDSGQPQVYAGYLEPSCSDEGIGERPSGKSTAFRERVGNSTFSRRLSGAPQEADVKMDSPNIESTDRVSGKRGNSGGQPSTSNTLASAPKTSSNFKNDECYSHESSPSTLGSSPAFMHLPSRRQADGCTAAEPRRTNDQHAGVSASNGFSEEPLAESRKLEVPNHLAIIMDGNSRWAKARGLPTAFGHERGVDSLLNLVKMCIRWGVVALTVYAFSTENWLRPKGEVEMLMGLFERVLQNNLAALDREKICLRVVGEIERLPASLQRAIAEAHERTAGNDALLFTIGVSYSGRQDLVQACQALASAAAEGRLDPSEITEATLSAHLGMATESTGWNGKPVGDPDLLIRTSGEQRLSNFLLWQLAYTELYFTDTLWPDFGERDFVTALEHYHRRERRFGARR